MPKKLPPTNRPDFDLTPSSAKPKSSGPKRTAGGKKAGGGGRGRTSRAALASAIYLVFLLVFWALQYFAAESYWFLTLLAYLPQYYLGVPLLLLFYCAFRQKSKAAAGYNTASLLLFVFLFMGFNLPVSRLLARDNAAAKPPKSVKALRVLNFNCILSDQNMNAVATEIKKQGADVICLQEAPLSRDAKLAKKLLALFPGWYSSRADELITLSPHIITAARVFRTTDKKATGILKTVIDLDGQDVAIFNVHIIVPTSMKGTKVHTEQARPVRARQLQLLVQEASQETLPVVIMGDFNTPPRGPAYRAMSARWTDAFRKVGWGTGHTFHSAMPMMRIDYIWTNDRIQVRNCVIPSSSVSDHSPLLASLWVKKTQ